ncbi:hypothetical protein CDAR_543211 [Caerostris darwini]|uniref:Uncharacterized protein n=1 Tax=Caerostris darwini TaxID=1538125 RepID=A0AAV4WZJ6_9ARAC|nr:hypothetical protein CDAR_543211 [Caerostris darwini]
MYSPLVREYEVFLNSAGTKLLHRNILGLHVIMCSGCSSMPTYGYHNESLQLSYESLSKSLVQRYKCRLMRSTLLMRTFLIEVNILPFAQHITPYKLPYARYISVDSRMCIRLSFYVR